MVIGIGASINYSTENSNGAIAISTCFGSVGWYHHRNGWVRVISQEQRHLYQRTGLRSRPARWLTEYMASVAFQRDMLRSHQIGMNGCEFGLGAGYDKRRCSSTIAEAHEDRQLLIMSGTLIRQSSGEPILHCDVPPTRSSRKIVTSLPLIYYPLGDTSLCKTPLC